MGAALVVVIVATLASVVAVVTRLLEDPPRKERSKMTDRDVKLYRSGAAILNRLVNVTDLTGDFGEDVLSAKTRGQIEEWLADYKKQLDKL
jgi:hypothetical protein